MSEPSRRPPHRSPRRHRPRRGRSRHGADRGSRHGADQRSHPDQLPPPPSPTTAPPTVEMEDVMDALSNVIDPELGLDFVELGLVYGVEVDRRRRAHHLHAHHPRLPDRPAGDRTDGRVRGRARRRHVGRVRDGFVPPWSPERMTEDASSPRPPGSLMSARPQDHGLTTSNIPLYAPAAARRSRSV